MDLPECKPPPFRLTCLSQTDVLPLLPFPVLPVGRDGDGQASAQGDEQAMAKDPLLLNELQQLLQAADVSHLRLRHHRPTETAAPSLLAEQLLLRNAEILTCSTGFPTPHAPNTPAPTRKCIVQGAAASAAQNAADQEEDMQCTKRSAQADGAEHDRGLAQPHPKRRRTARHAKAAKPLAPAYSSADAADVLCKLLARFFAREARLRPRAGSDDDDEDEATAPVEDILSGDEEETVEGHGLQALLQQLQQLSGHLLAARATPGTMQLVPLEQLLRLLQVLEPYVQEGRTRLISPDDEADSEDSTTALLAVEATVACLHVLACGSMPPQLYREDLIEGVLGHLKACLLSNVLPFHDARLCRAHRPQLLDAGDQEDAPVCSGKKKGRGTPATSSKKAGRNMSLRVPEVMGALAGRLANALELAGGLLGAVALQPNAVLPLLRAACQALAVDGGLDALQVKCIGLLVAGFRRFRAQRGALMEEVLTALLPNLALARGHTPRRFLVGDGGGATAIHVASALFLQMLQASVELPPLDADVAELRDCYAPAMHWADAFWSACLNKLAGGRAARADGSDVDARLLTEALLTDALLVHALPAWPAALPALLRLVGALGGGRGLTSPDAAVRQAAVELLGQVAAQGAFEAQCAQRDAGVLSQLLAAEGLAEGEDSSSLIRRLLLEHLADPRAGGDAALAASAREFMLCQALAEEAGGLVADGQPPGPDQAAAALARARGTLDILARGSGPAGTVSAGEAAVLARAAVQAGPLGRGRLPLLRRIADATDPSKQAPATRAKAVRALGGVVRVDAGLLALPEVQAGVGRALRDEAASVRQAAVDLLGAHIVGRPDLAAAYFDTLVTASRDASTSVRKAALRILWEACIRPAGFPRASEACVAVLQRVADAEESIHELVSKVFHGLWFASGRADAGSAAERPAPAAAAQQLADVAAAVYEAGGPGIHLPLDGQHALVAVLRKALEREGKERPGKEWQAGRGLACALLEGLLAAREAGGGSAEELGFPYLVALHALALTDVALCTPAEDPARIVRCLAPYLKFAPAGAAAGREAAERRDAECLLCILAVVDSIVTELAQLTKALAAELEADLCKLINKHPYIQVVNAACKTLASLARTAPGAAVSLAANAQNYLSVLQSCRASTGASAFLPRYFFILGHLMRYGADVIEATPLPNSNSGKAPTAADCQAACLAFFDSPSSELKVREAALQAIGCVGIARPPLLLAPGAQAAMSAALSRAAPTPLKIRALHCLAELLKAEEERLTVAQLVGDDKQDKLAAPAGAGSAAADRRHSSAELPAQNGKGDGDSLAISSGILQTHWDLVLELATDAGPPARPDQAARAGPGDPAGAAVRRHAIAVMDAVDRNGLVAPWTAAPHLLALTTDPNAEVAGRALRVLRRVAGKQAEMFQTCLPAGLRVTAAFHAALAAAQRPAQPLTAGAPEEVIRGLGALYAELLQPSRPSRAAFLAALVKPFDAAANLNAAPGAAAPSLRLLGLCAHVAAMLPYARADEPLTVLHHADAVVARRAADVLSGLRASAAQAPEEAPQPVEGEAARQCGASLALCMLLLLKQHLRGAYALTPERIAAFNPSVAELRKQEERQGVTKAGGVPCRLDQLRLDAGSSAALLCQQYKALKALLNADAAGYVEGTPLVSKRSGRASMTLPAIEAAEAADGGEGSGEVPGEAGVDRGAAGATPACAAAAGRRIAHMQGAGGGPGSGVQKLRWSGTCGKATGRGSKSRLAGAGAATTAKKKGRGLSRRRGQRSKVGSDSGEEDDVDPGEEGSEDEYVGGRARKAAPARRRLEPVLQDV